MKISRSEQVLRSAILDVLRLQPADEVGARLRRALNESTDHFEHPEDRCEECREAFPPWVALPDDWKLATGRSWGGPILCRPCYLKRLTSFGGYAARIESS